MKIIYLTVVVFLINTGLVFAHCGMCQLDGAKGSDKGAMSGDWMAKKIEKMTSELGLSEEQAVEVEALMTEKMEKKKAIKAEKHKAIKAVKEEYSAKIKAVLDDEQKIKYDAMKAESKKGSMKSGGHDHGRKGSDYDTGGSELEDKK